MGTSAIVVDGVIQDTSASANSLSGTKKTSNSTLDKDAFLQLLVAQMKYQDPLEPTSNTEYISQLATFSELEEMQNMTSGLDLQRASALVGKEVILAVTSAVTGNTEYIRGNVDYVQMENNKAYLCIGGELYSVDDLYNVVDEKYAAAYDKASALIAKVVQLPKVDYITMDNAEDIEAIAKTFNEMNDYEKSFIASDAQKIIQEYITKLEELKGQSESTS